MCELLYQASILNEEFCECVCGGEPTDALIASDFLKLGRLSWFKSRADDLLEGEMVMVVDKQHERKDSLSQAPYTRDPQIV